MSSDKANYGAVDVDEAERMRGEGKTLTEIGAHFGCSKQAVAEKLKKRRRNRRRYEDIFEACPYIGLRNYMLSHPELRISDMSIVLFGSAFNPPLSKTRDLFYGRDTRLSVSSIKNMEASTGMSFAELFRRETDV